VLAHPEDDDQRSHSEHARRQGKWRLRSQSGRAGAHHRPNRISQPGDTRIQSHDHALTPLWAEPDEQRRQRRQCAADRKARQTLFNCQPQCIGCECLRQIKEGGCQAACDEQAAVSEFVTPADEDG